MILAEDINPFQETLDKLLHNRSSESLNVVFTFKHHLSLNFRKLSFLRTKQEGNVLWCPYGKSPGVELTTPFLAPVF